MPDPAPRDLSDVPRNKFPRHVAVIMDGNGRWAVRRGLERVKGHQEGARSVRAVVTECARLRTHFGGPDFLTLYSFSIENWKRPVDEVRFLMQFNEGILTRHRDTLNEWGVRIRFAGRRDWRVPRRVLKRMDESIELTRGNRRMTFTIAFNYGGRAEIVDAVKGLVAAGVPAEKISEKAIRAHLYDPEMPDPDVVIRTSGEHRISNFLLWELAYSELVFTDVLWPDFRRQHLFDGVREYQNRDRRFGGVE